MIDVDRFQHLHVTASEDGAVVEVRFHHGKANEIGSPVLDEIGRLASALVSDPDARALISWSDRKSHKGTPIFVAGADVAERRGWGRDHVASHVRRQRAILASLREAPVFHVVVVGGVAFGWGTEYLLTADQAFAAPGARFALPETGLGIVPGAGGTSELWSRIGPRQALRLGMTGEAVDCEEASRIGLVDRAFPDHDAAMVEARRLCRLAATRSPTANAAFKRALLQSLGAAAPDRASFEDGAYAHCLETGEAAIGREHFAEARAGQGMPWGPKRPWRG